MLSSYQDSFYYITLLLPLAVLGSHVKQPTHATSFQIPVGNAPTSEFTVELNCKKLSWLRHCITEGKSSIKWWQSWSTLSSPSRQWSNKQWTGGALNLCGEPERAWRRWEEWRMLPGCSSDSSSSLCLHPCWQRSSTILIKVWCLLN